MPELTEARDLMRQALALEEQGNLDEALAAYDRLLELVPGHVGAWSNRAGLLLQQGRLLEARGSLNRALAADPNNILLGFNLGLLLLQGFDEPAQALPYLERAHAAGFPEAAEPLEICRELLG